MIDMPIVVAANDLCVNSCLYNEDKGCLPGAEANTDKCFVESQGKRIMEIEAFIREEAKKLPPEPPPGEKPEPPKEPEKSPEQAAKPPEAPRPAEPRKPTEAPKPATPGAAAAEDDPSSSPLPLSLRRKPEDITDE